MGKDQDRPLFSLAASCLQVADVPDKTLKALYQSFPEVVCLVLKGESGEERFHWASDLKLQEDSVALLKLPATKEGPFLERLPPLFLFSIFLLASNILITFNLFLYCVHYLLFVSLHARIGSMRAGIFTCFIHDGN